MARHVAQFVSLIFLIGLDCTHTAKYMEACLYDSTSRLRTNAARFSVRDIDFTLCSHYIYCCASIDPEARTVLPADRSEEGPSGLYRQFNDAKNKNPTIKTILSIGGFAKANNQAFENLYKKDATYVIFARNAVSFAKQTGFDGLNIHWETAYFDMGRIALTTMLQQLKMTVSRSAKDSNLMVTMTGHGLPIKVARNYNVMELSKYVDYVFVQSKDLVIPGIASFFGPLFHNKDLPGKSNNVYVSLHFWNNSGMPYNKLVMCVTALGHYVRLKDPSKYTPGASCTSEVLRGPTYRLDESLAYPEVCEMLRSSHKYFDHIQKNPYLVKGSEWVGYTDKESLYDRIKLMMRLKLGGIAFTKLDEDDFSGTSCKAGKFPLLTFIRDALDPESAVSRALAAEKQAQSESVAGSTTRTKIALISLVFATGSVAVRMACCVV